MNDATKRNEMNVLKFLRFLVAGIALAVAAAAQAAPISLTDIAGRKVTLPHPAKRIVLAQARYLPVLGLLTPDPVSILAGWSDEFKSSYPAEYRSYLAKFPALANVPVVGQHTAASFSVEKALAVKPDLVLLTASFAGLRKGSDPNASPLIRSFTAAGVPVLVVDFFIDPLKNTVPSVRLLGQALGRSGQAEDFIRFYQEQMQRVAGRVAAIKSRPTVLVHAHAGTTDCCNSPGIGTFDDMITFAGGHNIGADVLKTPTGQLSLEYVLSRNPEIYIATGTGGSAARGLAIGEQATPQQAGASLHKVVAESRLGAIAAVRSGNAHGIWHGFNDSPLNVVFIQALAAWINPEAFRGVSAADTLAQISRRFMAVPMSGTYLIDWRQP